MKNTDLIELGKQVFDSQIESMQKVRELISDNFPLTAHKIAEAGKVIHSGTGKSGYIAR